MPADPQPQSDPDLARLDSAVLEQRLGDLIRHYVHDRSASLAALILRHIETLCRHSDYHGDPGQRCVYHRLARHWRWLAQHGSGVQGGVSGNRA
jgi:hypothetical protein